MMRRALIAAVIGLGLAAPAPAVAAEPSWLRSACADGDLYYVFGACAGYLLAVAEAAPERYCLPEGTDYLTINMDAQRAMAGLPTEHGETSAGLAAVVLGVLYPC